MGRIVSRTLAVCVPSIVAAVLSGCGAAATATILALSDSDSGGGAPPDAPPLVEELSVVPAGCPDRIDIEFRIHNEDSGQLAARVEYNAEGVRLAASPVPELAPLNSLGSGDLVHFTWDAARDLEGRAAMVGITVTPIEDGREGSPASIGGVRAGNTPVEVDDVKLSSAQDVIFVSFVVRDADPGSDRARLVALELSVCGEDSGACDWHRMPEWFLDAVTDRDFPTSPEGETGNFSFSVSLLDRDEIPLCLRAVARPGFVGELRARVFLADCATANPPSGESACSLFDFNDPPSVLFLPLPPEALLCGVIPIRYRIFDREENPADIEVDFDLGDGQGFRPANEFPGPMSSGTSGLSTLPAEATDDALPFHTFLWDALSQTGPREQFTLRLRARDREEGTNTLFAGFSRDLVRPIREIPAGVKFPLASGDFNDDGFPEALLVATRAVTSDRTVTVLPGGRHGLSRNGESLDADACWLGMGDFNRDSVLDAAFWCAWSERPALRVFLGGSEGLTAAPGDPIPLDGFPLFSAGVDFNDMARSADFNGDGHDDLVLQIPPLGDFQFFRGAADGLEPGELLLPSGDENRVHNPWAFLVDDFNSDGFPDVISANQGRDDVTVIGGSKDGPKWVKNVAFAARSWISFVASGRFDGDEHADLLALSEGLDRVYFLRGAEDPEWKNEMALQNTVELELPGRAPHQLWPGDFNGDSLTDVVVLHKESTFVTVILGDREGPRLLGNVDVGSIQSYAQSADFNGDGLYDVVVRSDPVALLVGSASGGLEFHSSLRIDPAGPLLADGPPLVIDDFDGNGTPELLVGDREGNSVLHLEGVRGGLRSASEAIPIERGAVAVAAEDFDLDGFPDLATANREAGTVSFLRGRPDGLSGALSIALGSGARPAALLVGNFDPRDEEDSAYPDLLVLDVAGPRVIVLRGWPGGLSSDERSEIDAIEAPRAGAPDDFDGDGFLDVAVASWTRGEVQVLGGGPDGLCAIAEPIRVGDQPIALLSGDFDGDERPDLLVANWGSGSVTCIFGGDDGLGHESTEIAIGRAPHAFAREDFDGDGLLEVAVADWVGDGVHVLDFAPDRSIEVQTTSVRGEFPIALATADFDGDGFPDLAASNHGSDSLSVLRGRPRGLSAATALKALEGGGPRALEAFDSDGDGYPDALLTNEKTGEVMVFRGGPAGLRWGGIAARLTRPEIAVGADFDADGFGDLAVVDTAALEVAVLRQCYLTPTVHARLEAETSISLRDGRWPPQYEVAIASGAVARPTPLTIVAAELFPLPQADASRSGRFLTAVTRATALLGEDAPPLTVPATLTLRLLERARDSTDASSLRVFRRERAESLPVSVEIVEDFHGGRGARFEIESFGVYVVAEEKERESE